MYTIVSLPAIIGSIFIQLASAYVVVVNENIIIGLYVKSVATVLNKRSCISFISDVSAAGNDVCSGCDDHRTSCFCNAAIGYPSCNCDVGVEPEIGVHQNNCGLC